MMTINMLLRSQTPCGVDGCWNGPTAAAAAKSGTGAEPFDPPFGRGRAEERRLDGYLAREERERECVREESVKGEERADFRISLFGGANPIVNQAAHLFRQL